MIIRTVRSNSPASLLLIPLVAIVLWIPGFLHPTPPVQLVAMPLFRGIDAFCRSHPEFAVTLGFIFSLGQAFLLNYLIQVHQVLTKKSWLPALLFVVLTACTPGLLWFHPEMPAGILLLGTLHLLLGTYRTDRAFGAVFKAGFLLGLAGLIYAPSVVFVFFGIIAIIILRPFIWREWVIFIIGLTIPWIYSGVWFFLKDELKPLTHEVLIDPIVHRDFFLKLPMEYYALSAVTGLLLMVAGARFVAGSGTSTLKTKKSVTTMIWFLIISITAVLPAQNYAVAGFIFCIYPLSLFISNYFLLARRLWIAEIIFLMLLGSIAVSYFTKDIMALFS
ncbi:MAG TPA: DUF6427 family protein [Bacteroidia bacterium]|nr:DUF6427 family protein [Bacteroidia bacterium]